ncbi:MAG: hypothetical protein Fur002_16790 [Anaerolineales bacterium]
MNELTPQFIAQKLDAAYRAMPETDGYAEIPLDANPVLKCAAVLLPLFWLRGEWHILYTRRTDRVESHKGQVSFPGGACDEGESTPEQTALREAQEEIGLRPSDVKVLGRLSSLVTVSYFRVTPVVGVIPFPYAFQPSGAEVARIFSMPLLWLAQRGNYWEFPRGERKPLVAYHPFDGELLWGATAMMTVDFLKVIGALGMQYPA